MAACQGSGWPFQVCLAPPSSPAETPERPVPPGGPLWRFQAVSCLLHDADDPLHAELGVLAAVLGVHEAGQHPVPGPVADDLLLVAAVRHDVVEGVEAG